MRTKFELLEAVAIHYSSEEILDLLDLDTGDLVSYLSETILENIELFKDIGITYD